ALDPMSRPTSDLALRNTAFVLSEENPVKSATGHTRDSRSPDLSAVRGASRGPRRLGYKKRQKCADLALPPGAGNWPCWTKLCGGDECVMAVAAYVAPGAGARGKM